MNIVIFASDAKHLSYVNSIIGEAAKSDLNVFALICQDTQLRDPIAHADRYKIVSNAQPTQPTYSETLNMTLPFKPDWLIVSRVRWNPETNIVREFKHKLGAKTALVEPNSAMINSVNQFLEAQSKNRFINDIDVFFDHSEFIKNQRRLLGFKGNLVVTGNPKHDINLDIDDDQLSKLREYYKIDPAKKQVLFFTFANKYRYNLFAEFEKFKKEHPEYQYFVKPYPGEPFSPAFRAEYFPKFFIEGVTPILEESHIWGMYNLCDIHIGSLSSVMYASYYLGKEVHEFSKEIHARENLESNLNILNSDGGNEDKLRMWLDVFNTDVEGFKDLTSPEKILPMLKNNEQVWNNADNFVSYSERTLKMYDEFNDKQASKRIINYLLSYEK